MDPDTIRRVIRAARTLLRWDVARFATALGVGQATVKRVESGAVVKAETLARLVGGLRGIGVVVVADARIAGTRIVVGVCLGPEAQIGPEPLAKATATGSRKKGPFRLRDEDENGVGDDDPD